MPSFKDSCRRSRDGLMEKRWKLCRDNLRWKEMPRSVAQNLFVQFRIRALVGAGLNLGINRETAGPSLDHEIDGNETLEEGNRQLNSGIGTFRIVTDGDLITP